VEGLVPSETEEEIAHRVRAINVGALTTLGTFGHTNWRKMVVINLDRLAPYEEITWDKRP
jgi:general stress protein 26